MNYYPFFLDQTFLIMIPSIMYTVPYSGFSLINVPVIVLHVWCKSTTKDVFRGGRPPQIFRILTVRSRSLTTAVEKEKEEEGESRNIIYKKLRTKCFCYYFLIYLFYFLFFFIVISLNLTEIQCICEPDCGKVLWNGMYLKNHAPPPLAKIL